MGLAPCMHEWLTSPDSNPFDLHKLSLTPTCNYSESFPGLRCAAAQVRHLHPGRKEGAVWVSVGSDLAELYLCTHVT
jgi:hypothetical protein